MTGLSVEQIAWDAGQAAALRRIVRVRGDRDAVEALRRNPPPPPIGYLLSAFDGDDREVVTFFSWVDGFRSCCAMALELEGELADAVQAQA